LRIIHRYVSHLLPLAIRKIVQCRLEVVDVLDRLAAELGDDGTARNCGL